MRWSTWCAALGLVLGSCLLLTGCEQASSGQTGPPPVTVALPIQRVVTDYEDYTGRLAAIESVQITARVTGYLTNIYFGEGMEVKEGSVLCEIDPRPYQAAYDQAKAQVDQNQAGLNLAIGNRQRYELAFKNKAVSEQDVQTYRSQEAQAAATLEASKAALETARLNLQWTKVTAPVSGLLGQALVSRGNLITADSTKLTSMVSLDPMYVYFDVDEATVERIQQLIREGKLKSALPGEVEPSAPDSATKTSSTGPLVLAIKELQEHSGELRQVFLGLAYEKGFPHVAYVDFVNNQIALSTATLQVRAVFWNHKPKIGPRTFAPGMFVRVRVPTSPAYKALLVRQEAIGTALNLKFVDVLNDQDQVEQRNVTLGGLQDDLQVVTGGLQAKDRVVINGLQHVQPGVKVTPKVEPMQPPAQTPSQPPTSTTKAAPAAGKSSQP